METVHLNHKHIQTLQQIFRHPAPTDVEWHDVVELMKHIGTVEEEKNGNLRVTVNGITEVLRPHGTRISDMEEMAELRRFLERAGHESPVEEACDPAAPLRLLVVITEKESRVFRCVDKDSVPQRIHPYDPHEMLVRLRHEEGPDRAAHAPQSIDYYKAIAQTLIGAEEVLLMGHGTGAGQAMAYVVDYLKKHRPDLAQKIVGTLVVDVEALTDDQILEQARTFFQTLDMAANP
ncbi:MAG: hypothetical protein JWL77_2164 [Chthonomonadaceae bacterium]|nr:hypothetical protein [Chthonomonadaceae bacterium]